MEITLIMNDKDVSFQLRQTLTLLGAGVVRGMTAITATLST
jgi:hypothetical protein